MAQVSKFCNGAQSAHVFPRLSTPNERKSICSVSSISQVKRYSTSWGLKQKSKRPSSCNVGGAARISPVRVMASVATAEKPSRASEIVLQPIREISGTVKLPGSKSLSNRILLLAALSEVFV